MSRPRNAWHSTCEELLVDLQAPTFETHAELKLGAGPPRADFLLLRRVGHSRRGDHKGRIFRDLWPMLPEFSVAEYKSPVHPLRRGDAPRLFGCTALFHARRQPSHHRRDFASVFLVASLTPTLDEDLARLDLIRRPLGHGYYALDSGPYQGFVAAIDEVATAAREELLCLIGAGNMELRTEKAFRWAQSHLLEGPRAIEMQRLEGYEKVLEKALARFPLKTRMKILSLTPEQVLATYKPKQRLKGLKPEQRLVGLKPEEQVLAMSDVLLRQLPVEYLRSLPPAIRRKVARRLKAH